MLNILKTYMICIVIYYSYQKKLKLINARYLYAICLIKKAMLLIQDH